MRVMPIGEHEPWGIVMSLLFNPVLQKKPLEDILLFVRNSSIYEAREILTKLGHGAEEVHGEFGTLDIIETCQSYNGSLLACEVDELVFEGGPHKVEWFVGSLQKILYDRLLRAIVEHGPEYVAEIVGLSYWGDADDNLPF